MLYLFRLQIFRQPAVTRNPTEGKEDVMEGEVLGGKGISMELLHKRLGHTSQGGMKTWLKEHGISHQTIPARSPQSNGVAERMNRSLQDRARSMLVGAGLGSGSHRYRIIHQEQGSGCGFEQNTR